MSNLIPLSEVNGLSDRISVNIPSLAMPSERMQDEVLVNPRTLSRAVRWAGYSTIAISGYQGDEPEIHLSGSVNPDGSLLHVKDPTTSHHEALGEKEYGYYKPQSPVADIKINVNAIKAYGDSLSAQFDPKNYANLYDRAIKKELTGLTKEAYSPTKKRDAALDAVNAAALAGIGIFVAAGGSLDDFAKYFYLPIMGANYAFSVLASRRTAREFREGNQVTEERASLFRDLQYDRAACSLAYLATHRFFIAYVYQ